MVDNFIHELVDHAPTKLQTRVKEHSAESLPDLFDLNDSETTDTHTEMLRKQSRKAFQKWLDANNKWSAAKRKVEQTKNNAVFTERVKKMEKRIDEAADTYEATIKALYEKTLKLKKIT